MGNQQSSRNYINNVAETITRIIQENAQTCEVKSSQINEIVTDGECQNVVIKNVDFKNVAGIDFSCMQNADLNAKIASEMQNQLEQMAKAFLSGLRFDILSTQEAENFVTNHLRLVTEVINQLNQTCAVTAGQYNGFTCRAGSLLIENSSFSNIIQSVFDCVQQGSTVADVKTELSNFIKQVAISENKGLSFDLLLVAVIIVVIVLAILIINKGLDWKFLAIGVPIIAIIIYLILANKRNWWPFKSKFDDKKAKPAAKVPTPPPPLSVQKYNQEQAKLKSDQYWGRQLLPITTCGSVAKKMDLTPEQYRHLQYGDDSIAFERPYDKKNCKPVPVQRFNKPHSMNRTPGAPPSMQTTEVAPLPNAYALQALATPDPLRRT